MIRRALLVVGLAGLISACGEAPVEPDKPEVTEPDKPEITEPDTPEVKDPEPTGPFIEEVPAALTPPPGTQLAKIPDNWFEGPRMRVAHLKDDAAPPPIIGDDWNDGMPFRYGDHRGKVVLVVFWASWSAPSRKALGIANNVYTTMRKQGLEVVGVCASRGGQHASTVHEKMGITFRTCIDHDDKTANRYAVDGYPDFYIVDKWGRLRLADVESAHLDAALKALLAE